MNHRNDHISSPGTHRAHIHLHPIVRHIDIISGEKNMKWSFENDNLTLISLHISVQYPPPPRQPSSGAQHLRWRPTSLPASASTRAWRDSGCRLNMIFTVLTVRTSWLLYTSKSVMGDDGVCLNWGSSGMNWSWKEGDRMVWFLKIPCWLTSEFERKIAIKHLTFH